jgi:hypothetical protein
MWCGEDGVGCGCGRGEVSALDTCPRNAAYQQLLLPMASAPVSGIGAAARMDADAVGFGLPFLQQIVVRVGGVGHA